MTPHLVAPEILPSANNVAAGRVDLFAEHDVRKTMFKVRAVDGVEKQLPTAEVTEHLGFRAGHRQAAVRRFQCDTVARNVHPLGRNVADIGHHLAAVELCLERAPTGDHIGHRIVRQIGHNMPIAQINDGFGVRNCNPAWDHIRRIGPFAFAFDGHFEFIGPVAAGDVRLIAPAIRGQRDRVIKARPLGNTADVEGKENIGQIGQQQDRNRKGDNLFATE